MRINKKTKPHKLLNLFPNLFSIHRLYINHQYHYPALSLSISPKYPTNHPNPHHLPIPNYSIFLMVIIKFMQTIKVVGIILHLCGRNVKWLVIPTIFNCYKKKIFIQFYCLIIISCYSFLYSVIFLSFINLHYDNFDYY